MYLSLCIPTRGRESYLREVIESVCADKVDPSLYEIVVCDNSDGPETKQLVEELSSSGVDIKYFYNPVKGFYNSIEALSHGAGEFLKLHNNYTKFKVGEFSRFIEKVVSHSDTKPQLLFTDGNIGHKSIVRYNNFEEFIAGSSYWHTWSSAFSIWKVDFEQLFRGRNVNDLNDQFPHTSLLFLNSEKSQYVVDDCNIFENMEVAKKGGYNIFYTFAVIYMAMLDDLLLENKVSAKVVRKIKRQMKGPFFARWHSLTIGDERTKSNYTFDSSDYEQYLKLAYGRFGYFEVIVRSHVYTFARTIRYYSGEIIA